MFESLFKKAPKVENIPENVSTLIRQKIRDELGANDVQEAQKMPPVNDYKSLSEQEDILFEQRIKNPEYVKNVIQEIKDRENTLKKDPEAFAGELNKIKEHHEMKARIKVLKNTLLSHLKDKNSNEDKNI
ncbi:MAG: hypothetical protein V4504_01355 [Patescibacteria group bacterium]